MATDFISTYVPAFVELSPEEVTNCRERLSAFFSTMFPELDTTPNSVLGDLIVTPQAYQVAALEKGMDRLLSDLDMGNVANNEVYNCDFVTKYLKNFAVSSEYELRSSGVIRLVFSKDEDVILDRGTQFRLNGFIFTLYLPNNGPFYIKQVGTSPETGSNGVTLIDAGSGAYFADVPVVGHSGEVDVAAGTSAEVSVIIPSLGAATALIDFYSGVDTNSTAELAARTQKTIYSASLNTRNGAIRYVENSCPFVDSVYAIRTGDPEMLRGYYNTLGVAGGCMDVYARSKSYAFVETQTLRLYADASGDNFTGEFTYTGQPYYIDSITHSAVQSPNLEHTVIAVNVDGLGARGSYTSSEKLYITVPNQKVNGDSIFNPSVAADGRTYVDFTITYHTDPLLPSIAATLKNSDYTPINVNLQTRGFIPIVIKKFNVRYVRKDGVIPDLVTAESDIRSYMDRLGAPDAYADSEIARIMGEAGVKYTAGIDVYAVVQWSLGDYITPLKSNSLIKVVPTKTNTVITTSAGLRAKYPGDTVNVSADDMYACSIRNTRYYMLDTAVSFTEVKEM